MQRSKGTTLVFPPCPPRMQNGVNSEFERRVMEEMGQVRDYNVKKRAHSGKKITKTRISHHFRASRRSGWSEA